MKWLERFREHGAKLPRWAIDVSSSSGYDREAAVRELGLSGQSAALPILLERANDWVPEVRVAAYAALQLFLEARYLADWRLALGEVAALDRMARADHSQLLHDIERFLSLAPNLKSLRMMKAGMPREGLRFLHTLEWRLAEGEAAQLQVLGTAIESDDVVIASDAAAKLENLAAPPLSLARTACASSFASVRLKGLRIALRTPDSATRELARALAGDLNANVRATALGALSEEREELLGSARRVLSGVFGASRRAVALDTLCALGAEDAAPRCEAATWDKAVAVRCLAYARLYAAASRADQDLLLRRSLYDRSPRVRRLAVARVRKGAVAPSSAELLEIHRASPGAEASLVEVAESLSPWSRFGFLLELVKRGADETARERLFGDLERFGRDMQRCFVSPTPIQSRELALLWAESSTLLPLPLQRKLSYQLDSFGVLAAR